MKKLSLSKLCHYFFDKIIDWILCPIFSLLPTKNIIMFESVPSMGDSPRNIFDYFIKYKINDNFLILYWLYGDNNRDCNIKNVKLLKSSTSRLKLKYYECRSICLISCNRFLIKHSKKQISFYFQHGSCFKDVSSYYSVPEGIDYVMSASEYMGILSEKIYNIPHEKMIYLGFPRNDAFAKESMDLHFLFPINYDKLVIWYPTYRQHKTGHSYDVNFSIPIIHNVNDAKDINDFAKENNILIIIKPHFAQNISYIKNLQLSNIIFIDDDFFYHNNISSYDFINASDALISDYSSVYYDYLLSDKPIALIWEDFDEISKNPGFAIKPKEFCIGTNIIYKKDELINFLYEISNGIDDKGNERKKLCDIVNYSNDGNNTERNAKFILERLEQHMNKKII